MPVADLIMQERFEAAPRFVFDVFTARLGDFWPIAYTFSGPDFEDAALEPHPGGEWYERNARGEHLRWGKVLEYEPGQRLVLEWGIGVDRKPVPSSCASQVELTFQPGPQQGTRLTLRHRAFERHGDAAQRMRDGMASPQGWPLILAELRRGVRRAARECPKGA